MIDRILHVLAATATGFAPFAFAPFAPFASFASFAFASFASFAFASFASFAFASFASFAPFAIPTAHGRSIATGVVGSTRVYPLAMLRPYGFRAIRAVRAIRVRVVRPHSRRSRSKPPFAPFAIQTPIRAVRDPNVPDPNGGCFLSPTGWYTTQPTPPSRRYSPELRCLPFPPICSPVSGTGHVAGTH